MAKEKTQKASAGFAVIETGGKQYKVSEGKTLVIEKLPGDMRKGAKIIFDKVLLTDDGSNTKVGAPYLSGAKVEAVLDEAGKGKKVVVIRYKAKSRYFKKRGHRQPFMRIKISSIK
jgi:large subunit ribosomal protein L21